MSQQSQTVVERSPTPDSELNEVSTWYEIFEDEDDNILHWFTPKKARVVCQEVLEFAQEREMPCEKIIKWMKILDKICAAPRLEEQK
ncbi:hypothetical protein niasHS_009219 [Heterodera schachtii]|uniref:Uncharacterized protein n=1 Tax=Heterodera schachtii TaxID=97005 RepID=A0ABD2JBE0_HETSC